MRLPRQLKREPYKQIGATRISLIIKWERARLDQLVVVCIKQIGDVYLGPLHWDFSDNTQIVSLGQTRMILCRLLQFEKHVFS